MAFNLLTNLLNTIWTQLLQLISFVFKLGVGVKHATYSTLAKVGQYNPQLLRELQGKLRWRNLFFTSLLSLVTQFCLLLQPLTQLPNANSSGYNRGPYCLVLDGDCVKDATGQYVVNWPFVWADVFHHLSFVLVWGLIVGGVYLLAADLAKETRRGTLNFLRMSPLSGNRILIGKLLGVPSLLYLSLGLMLPLHLLMGMMSGCSLIRLVGFYSLLGAIAICFYSAALWFSLLATGLFGLQTWLFSGLSFGLLMMSMNVRHSDIAMDWFRFFNPINLFAGWEAQGFRSSTTRPFGGDDGFDRLGWFFLWLGDHSLWFWCFALANALLLGLWFWAALLRKFQTPTLTSVSKLQSYSLTLCLATLMMGFEFQRRPGAYSSDDFFSYLITMGIWSILLMFLLLPAKQGMLDWARYCYQGAGQRVGQGAGLSGRSRRSGPSSGLASGCLRHEGSPSAYAFGLNMAIITGVLVLGIAVKSFSSTSVKSLGMLVFWLFCAVLFCACSFLLQFIVLSNFVHWRWLALGTVSAALFGWPIVLLVLGIEPYHSTLGFLWLTTIFSNANEFGMGAAFVAIATHLSVLFGLNLLLNRRLQFLGQSEWKALMMSSNPAV